MSSSPPSGIVTTNDNERVIPATKRADGTIRKERRVRQGYVPQEDIAKYKNPWVEEEEKPKPTPKPEVSKKKSQKKNEKRKLKRKEEREKEGNLESVDNKDQPVVNEDSLDQIQNKINQMSINEGHESPAASIEENATTITIEQLEITTKRIKALEKKVRQIERIKEKKSSEPLNPDEEEKLSKLEQILEELRRLRQGETE